MSRLTTSSPAKGAAKPAVGKTLSRVRRRRPFACPFACRERERDCARQPHCPDRPYLRQWSRCNKQRKMQNPTCDVMPPENAFPCRQKQAKSSTTRGYARSLPDHQLQPIQGCSQLLLGSSLFPIRRTEGRLLSASQGLRSSWPRGPFHR